MAYATGCHMCHAYPRMPFEVEDVVAMVRKVFAGRVTFHDGASEIKPGITVHRIGGPSKGLQCIRVKTPRGAVVLPPDSTPPSAPIEQGRGVPLLHSPREVVRGSRPPTKP